LAIDAVDRLESKSEVWKISHGNTQAMNRFHFVVVKLFVALPSDVVFSCLFVDFFVFAKVVGATSSKGILVSAETATLIVCLLCRAASDLIEELLDDKRYNSRARPQADTSMLPVLYFPLYYGRGSD